MDDGGLKCIGDNQYGQLGLALNGTKLAPYPHEVPYVNLGMGRKATAVTCGQDFTCAILDDSTIKCWGYNNHGQLGLGHFTTVGLFAESMGDNLPAVNLGGGAKAVGVAAGMTHVCALLDTAQVKCWGSNAYGQLGKGDVVPANSPTSLSALNFKGLTPVALYTAGYRNCVVLSTRELVCWGRNDNAQLGLGDFAERGGTTLDANGLYAFKVDLGTGKGIKL